MQPISKALEIHGWMSVIELQWLRETALRLVQRRGRSKAVEAGSWLGRSTVAIAVDGIDLTCVDTFEGGPGILSELTHGRDIYAEFVANMNRLGLRPVVMRMDAEEAAAAFPRGYFDWIFLDCDKSAFPKQFWAWYPKLKGGGVYSGHDYSPEFPLVCQTLDASKIDYHVVYGTSIWWFTKPCIS